MFRTFMGDAMGDGGENVGVQISLRGVARTFPGGVEAVKGINLEIARGQFVALIGPSGCGKSTLLRMIAGLDRATQGEISFAASGDDRDGRGPRVAFVFQDAHLLPWRRVDRNIALPLEFTDVPPAERAARVWDAIRQVGLEDAVERFPAQLSGGMRMRVSLARALVTDPQLLLLDEPFAALDEITRHHLDDQLRALWARRRMTVLFVTHSIMEAAYLANRAIVLTCRPARAVLDHALQLPQERTAALRGEAAFAHEMRVLHEALARGERE